MYDAAPFLSFKERSQSSVFNLLYRLFDRLERRVSSSQPKIRREIYCPLWKQDSRVSSMPKAASMEQ